MVTPPPVFTPPSKAYNPTNFRKKRQKGQKTLTLLDAGQIAAAGLIFIGVLLVNANSYWKTIGHESFLPWYYEPESTWIGWQNWPNLIVNPLFWVAIVIALCVTLLKAIAAISIRSEYSDATFHGERKNLTLNDAWKEYKRSKKADQRGLVSLTAWALEFMITFTQNDPYRFRDPVQFLGCVLFVLAPNFCSVIFLKVIIDRFSIE